MNMVFRQRQYVRGEIVGRVDLARLFGPLEVPVTPRRWYILRTHPGREFRVMKTFRQRNISAWLPLNVSDQNVTRYRRGYEFIQQQRVTSPLISGAVIVPDCEFNVDRALQVDGVAGLLRFGEFMPHLTPLHVAQLRDIEAIGNTPKSKRDHKFAIGELVRVTTGPFAHFSARVERFDSKGRLSVGVDIFGRITPIEIDESALEAV